MLTPTVDSPVRRSPGSLRQKVFRYARRTPGHLGLILAGLVVLCLATGLAGVLDVQHRRGVLVSVADRSSPLANAAVTVYRSLSDADATATGVFLAGDQAPPEARKRYRRDITDAASALSTAAAGAPDVQTATAIAQLTAQLPVYAGLVETAGTYNRQRLSVGAAYLREASAFARNTMLPVAQQLYRDEMVRLASAQDDAGSTAGLPLTLGGLALIALIASQIYLGCTTNRTLNAGLLAATATVLAAVIWLGVASGNAADHNDAGRQDGTAQLEALSEARITALTARSEEALSLIARGSGKTYVEGFDRASGQLDAGQARLGSLAAARGRISQLDTLAKVDSAIGIWQAWRKGHQELRDHDAKGEYNKAVLLATGVDLAYTGTLTPPANGNTGMLSTDLDSELDAAVRQARARFDDQAAKATAALDLADIGIAILVLLAAVGVAFGMTPRIREYR